MGQVEVARGEGPVAQAADDAGPQELVDSCQAPGKAASFSTKLELPGSVDDLHWFLGVRTGGGGPAGPGSYDSRTVIFPVFGSVENP